MPIYCYRSVKSGTVRTFMRPVEDRDLPIKLDGEVFERDLIAEISESITQKSGESGSGCAYTHPQISVLGGIHPDQVPEARQRFKISEFTDGGDAIFRSYSHRKASLKEQDLIDRDGVSG